MDAKIIVKDLTLKIYDQSVLKNINVAIPKNKITVILGPSGCGKTTLLKTMNRLSDLIPGVHTSGAVFLDGKNIMNSGMDLVDIRQKMGLLAQRPYPLPMSIFNNITFGLRISGRCKKKFLHKRVEHYLKMVNLWDEVKDRLNDPASGLSIGQQQRLCLARGLAVDPEIILADEPTSALDPISSHAIEEKFLELKSQYTIVMVTHILRQAKRMADYIIFMYLGEVIECGTPDELFNNPVHPFTKSYLNGQFY